MRNDQHVCRPGCEQDAHLAALTTVPRVASSLDDLRVGQVVAIDNEGMVVEVTAVTASDVEVEDLSQLVEPNEHRTIGFAPAAVSGWVILSDPPPEPLVLSAKAQELFDRLAEAFYPTDSGYAPDLTDVALAFVDEVRRQETP